MADPTRTERRLIDSIRKAKHDGATDSETAASTPTATADASPATASGGPATSSAPKSTARSRRAPSKQPATTAKKSADPIYQWGRRIWPD